jgi:hypothetical protein
VEASCWLPVLHAQGELGFDKANTQLLINVRRMDVKQAIDRCIASMHGNDVILFFFSGHVSVV